MHQYCPMRQSSTLSARGTSRAHIIANLASKGVPAETAREAVDRLSVEYEEPELEAARRYARRRRLGPYRGADNARAECRDKDLAAMARAGFAGRVARQIIDAEREVYEQHNANAHRAIYFLGEEATDLYEGARAKAARVYARCAVPLGLFFTRGTWP